MNEEIDYFELNNNILEDFDNLMKQHLDKIKHLKIEKDITNNKLYNIISLCFNIETLEIDSDLKLDVNRVFASICKPELLKTLILRNVKLPTVKILSKFKNVKKLELENIRFSNLQEFISNFGKTVKIENISLKQVDFSNKSFEIFDKFTGVKTFKSINLVNAKLEKMDCIVKSGKIEEVEMSGNRIQFSEIDSLIRGDYKKKISLRLESKTNFKNLIVIEDKKIDIKISSEDLEYLTKLNNLSEINNIEVKLSGNIKFEDLYKTLKKVKNEINIFISDIANLTLEQSITLRDELNVKKIYVLDTNGSTNLIYEIDTFIAMREELENMLKGVTEELQKEEKFLYIYKYLLKNIEFEKSIKSSEDSLKIALSEKKCGSKGFAELLKNCLISSGFQVRVMRGVAKSNKKDFWYWIQVRINKTWYNSDIALDAKQKSKMKYCLMSNERMEKNYNFKSKSMYCVQNVNPKIVKDFWRRKNINIDKKTSMLQKIISKIKVLFKSNKKLAEPENNVVGGKEDDNT